MRPLCWDYGDSVFGMLVRVLPLRQYLLRNMPTAEEIPGHSEQTVCEYLPSGNSPDRRLEEMRYSLWSDLLPRLNWNQVFEWLPIWTVQGRCFEIVQELQFSMRDLPGQYGHEMLQVQCELFPRWNGMQLYSLPQEHQLQTQRVLLGVHGVMQARHVRNPWLRALCHICSHTLHFLSFLSALKTCSRWISNATALVPMATMVRPTACNARNAQPNAFSATINQQVTPNYLLINRWMHHMRFRLLPLRNQLHLLLLQWFLQGFPE
jgi:hypothetical protein